MTESKVIELIKNFSSIDFSNGINSYTISEMNLERLAEDLVKLFAIPVVTNCALPEWLDVGTRAEAKFIWESHKVTDDGLRVKAVKLIQKRALDCGYTVGIKKAMQLLEKHCL